MWVLQLDWKPGVCILLFFEKSLNNHTNFVDCAELSKSATSSIIEGIEEALILIGVIFSTPLVNVSVGQASEG